MKILSDYNQITLDNWITIGFKSDYNRITIGLQQITIGLYGITI